MSLSLSFCSGEAAQGAQTQHSSEELGDPGTAHRWCPARYKLVSRNPPSRKAPLQALRGTRKILALARAQCQDSTASTVHKRELNTPLNLSPRSTNPSLPPSPPSIPVPGPVLLPHISDHRGTVWCQPGSGCLWVSQPQRTRADLKDLLPTPQPQPRKQSLRNCVFRSIWRIFFPWTHSSWVSFCQPSTQGSHQGRENCPILHSLSWNELQNENLLPYPTAARFFKSLW